MKNKMKKLHLKNKSKIFNWLHEISWICNLILSVFRDQDRENPLNYVHVHYSTQAHNQLLPEWQQ